MRRRERARRACVDFQVASAGGALLAPLLYHRSGPFLQPLLRAIAASHCGPGDCPRDASHSHSMMHACAEIGVHTHQALNSLAAMLASPSNESVCRAWDARHIRWQIGRQWLWRAHVMCACSCCVTRYAACSNGDNGASISALQAGGCWLKSLARWSGSVILRCDATAFFLTSAHTSRPQFGTCASLMHNPIVCGAMHACAGLCSDAVVLFTRIRSAINNVR